MTDIANVSPDAAVGSAAPTGWKTTMSRFVPFNPLGLITGLVLIGLWQLLVETKILHYKELPAPSAIAGSLGQLVSHTDWGASLAHTVVVTIVGWALAGAVGVALGLAVGLSYRTWQWSMASIDVLRALPIIAFVPVAVLIFGLTSKMEVVLVVYAAFWPVVINTIAGVRSVSPQLRDVARTFHLSRLATVRKIVLPASAPQVIVGLRLALALSLVLAVVAEMVGNPAGLGYRLVYEQNALRPDLMFGYVFTIGIVGILLNALFVGGVRLAFPGLARNQRSAS